MATCIVYLYRMRKKKKTPWPRQHMTCHIGQKLSPNSVHSAVHTSIQSTAFVPIFPIYMHRGLMTRGTLVNIHFLQEVLMITLSLYFLASSTTKGTFDWRICIVKMDFERLGCISSWIWHCHGSLVECLGQFSRGNGLTYVWTGTEQFPWNSEWKL